MAKQPTDDPVGAKSDSRPVPKSASQAIKAQPGFEPPKPRRAKTSRNQIVVFFHFLFSTFVLALVLLAGVFYYGKVQFEKPGPLKQAMNYTVRSGASMTQVANGLDRRNIISDAEVFKWGLRAYGNEEALKAGEFEIPRGASMKKVMETLVSGRAILHPLTIVEGNTVFQAAQKIANDEILVGEMPEELPPEGMMIADTQRFQRGMTRSEIIARMQAQQETLVEQIWAKRAPDLPIADINEFVTMASIVEKETGVAEERPRVAAVFINRLRKGMRLQSDPTILYGIFGGQGRPEDRPIYRSDIEKPTPYNTYTIDGIPPGPIAIPGRAALEAVANPAQTDDLYFVADGTGGHVFANTLEQHNKNVAKWREIEKKRKEEQANTN
ncbi:endolytic transglycosylase MltG [Ahrensia marina]|uniref:Endolytic murein transglycosylase n=1 Tax=Ahrensia marina TaxID=1514904 RepID=A0A0M9GP96_9HYPH|nr:endolytic transglycosylase MltG [Ahrensia marina]KPB02460.1 4-amino-4-deoxychorismate lyase [Ahrensia marina]